MIGIALQATRFGYAAAAGTDAFADAAAQFAVKLALRSRQDDTRRAEEMVALMRSRVPQDSGRLFNGIAFEVDEDGMVTVSAEAVNPNGRYEADYAVFVEHGTETMDAQPFFYGSAEEVFGRLGADLDAAIDAASGDFR